ncbi:hypothetical protein IQ268_24635 [Oculatella sp. LEGE 06141]|uniref:hypothetical protein n=1 Tax=Oculatella sp. LEGE 06141 TaxID=1828648 RepID=UPI00187ECC4C|nr:hypothetical protein [Oculatella sp. LEGE 06141]MBE9181757.1 hypothetical protein [Oculatella sp. LEGE 06141]
MGSLSREAPPKSPILGDFEIDGSEVPQCGGLGGGCSKFATVQAVFWSSVRNYPGVDVALQSAS